VAARDSGDADAQRRVGIINYATESFVERANQLTDSRGVEVVLDSIGGQKLIDSIGVLAYRGRLVSVGVAARAGSAVEERSLWTRNNSLHGVFLGGALVSEYARVHAMIGDMLERVASGELQVEIDRSFPLPDAAAVHAYAESRKAFGQVVMAPRLNGPAIRASAAPSSAAFVGRRPGAGTA